MADDQPPSSGPSRKALSAYGLMIAGVVLIYLAIRHFGERLSAPAPATTAVFGAAAARVNAGDLFHVLLALAVVIGAARMLGSILRGAGQPPVVGEIMAGIMLGPSLLGRLAPGASAYLFSGAVPPYLNMLSQIGIILYMFLVGLELDPALLRKQGRAAVAISTASIGAPFVLGTLLALILYPRLSTNDVPFTCFSLFLAVSMSVTAFPVLARILTDRKIHKSKMGTMAITCAAVNDVAAWCLLAFVVAVARAEAAGVLTTVAMAIGYIAAMLLIVRPAMVRLSLLYGNRGRLTQGVLAMAFLAMLLSAAATDMIGIHPVFGAFALGAVIPHDSGMARELTDRLEDVVIVLLLPAFFAFTGLRTQIGLVSGLDRWIILGAIILVASAGKFGGSAIAARLAGLDWRDSSALGVLMNTRGLMELIVIDIGLEMRAITPELFAMLVIMALVTTFATTPILQLITSFELPKMKLLPALGEFAKLGAVAPEATAMAEAPAVAMRAIRPAAAAPPVPPRAHEARAERGAILAPVSNPESVPVLVELAIAASPSDAPPPRVLALVKPPSGGVRSGLREADLRVAPRSPALSAAMDLAAERGAAIIARAIWSNDPAADIIAAAAEPQIGWLLIGSHRAVFGADVMGGAVHQILERARALPIHVGVVINGGDRPFDRIFAVIDRGGHGRAALDLALRVARRMKSSLRAVLVPAAGIADDPELLAMIRDAGHTLGRRLHTDVLAHPTADQLARQTPGGLVIVAANLAEKVELPPGGFPDGRRCLVVVRGAAHEPAGLAATPTRNRAVN